MHTPQHIHCPPAARPWGPELASLHLAASRHGGSHRVCIEAASAEHHQRGANRLLHQRYSWRGYRPVSLPAAHAAADTHLPLTATRGGAVIGTLTVGFDGPLGLNCDTGFGPEVQALRAQGQRLCEFTKLAVQADDASTQVLAALFHVAFLAARKQHQVDLVLLEVNPRHVRYYQRVLGAEVVGTERGNDTVNAPAVLLAIRSMHIRQQLDQAACQPRPQRACRSLYAQAFSRTEEVAIVSRLVAQLSEARHGLQPAAFSFRLPAVAPEGRGASAA